MREFNTAGPIIPEDHYHIAPLARVDRDELLHLIERKKYFVLHAPRQTGKTTILRALRDDLNGSGQYRCVYVNVETGQSAREDVGGAMQAILGALSRQERTGLGTRRNPCGWATSRASRCRRCSRSTLRRPGRHGRTRRGARPTSTASPSTWRRWVDGLQYKEAGPQLLLQAFLQRIVNSGGRVEREYGLGRMRTDLLIVWPVRGARGDPRGVTKTVVECKLVRGGLEATVRAGLDQTRAYVDRCGAGAGHLVVFDRASGKSWDERVFRREERAGGARVTVWGM